MVTAAAPSGSINVNEGGVSILGGGFPTAKLQVGFVAEDVPDLVANNDRESLSPMDVVAVLTKVVQEQDRQLALQAEQLRAQSEELARQRAAIEKITASLGDANAAAPREARRATADRSS